MAGFGAHDASPAELRRRLHAEQHGKPFLLHRAAGGEERVLTLTGASTTVGRGPQVDVPLEDDPEVSRLHAQLERLGGAWVLSDDGLSQNGSYVNGERVSGRRRICDGDVLRFGSTEVLFRAPAAIQLGETRPASDEPAVSLSPTQRRVLVALCRPYRDGGTYARPATNRQIADELFLSVEAVKDHVRALFAKLGVERLPQNEKRLRLVERAFATGAISRHEL